MNDNYDVIIMGGGLAGLTLAMQVKRACPDVTLLVLEGRKGNAPEAAHKVGESTVELGTYYLREVLDLKDYLDEHQLPKHGLRFFFTPQHKDKIELRAELGTRERLPVPSHQLDRGIFENELSRRIIDLGVDVALGSRVRDVDLDAAGHTVTVLQSGSDMHIKGRWVVDATGRQAALKRKLNFAKDTDHNINAAWFRLDTVIDVQDWSTDQAWRSQVKPGLRRLGTVHLMGKGYWVWLIPLVSGSTSIGIVADPEIHDLDKFNTFEKAMTWLEDNEPLCSARLRSERDKVMDFRVLKHYAHDCGRFYSGERWGVTGDAGAFLDPFYSPGTDFIAMNNTWLTDLIRRDLAGESIAVRASVYERTHSEMFKSWIPIYLNKYPLMGCTQLMIVKIFWDWAVYWGIPTLLFVNEAFIDLNQLKVLSTSPSSVLQRLTKLNDAMQRLFVDWAPYDNATITGIYIDPYDLGFLREFHQGMEVPYQPEGLVARASSNLEVLEHVATEIFRQVSAKVNHTPVDLDIDPYEMSLNSLSEVTTSTECDRDIRSDVELMFF